MDATKHLGIVAVLFLELVAGISYSVESLDDSQTGNGFFHGGDDARQFGLSFFRLFFQHLADLADNQTCQRQDNQHEKGELWAEGDHEGEIEKDGQRVFDEHLQVVQNRDLDLLHVGGDTGNGVTFLSAMVEGEGQDEDL